MTVAYIQGKEQIDSPGYDEPLTLDSSGRLVMSTNHTQGTVVSVTNTPGSAGNPNVLKVDAQSSNWTSTASACVQCDADDTDPYLLKIEQAANTTEFISLGAAGSTYSTIGIGSADQLLMQTTANDKIQIGPTGTGNTRIGDGTPSALPSVNDNIYVSNDVEVDSTLYPDGAYLSWGTGGTFISEGLCTLYGNDGFGAFPLLTTTGWGRIQVEDDEEWAHFRWNASGVVTLESGSANIVVNTNPAGYFCIYYSGIYLVYHNRLGGTRKVASLHYAYA